MTLYLIGAFVSEILCIFVFLHKREELLRKYTRSAIVASTIILTLSSWIFPLMALYKTLKRKVAMFSKASQLKKTRQKNEKKLTDKEKKSFIETIDNQSGGKCQLCKIFETDEYHHSIYGSFGADKDDRSLMAICRGCHFLIHHSRESRSKEARQEAIEIGAINWSVHNG